MERKLTTILAADVVGYVALMERDEKGTHERLMAGRKELFEPQIAQHHGRVFKLMGDGMLAEFGSVVDAVECAVSLQRGLAERNANVPEDQRVQVRIGINLGDVMVEGGDLYGDGVNIAARLEAIAEPGAVCLSEDAYRQVRSKLKISFDDLGAKTLKNISEPVRTYRVAGIAAVSLVEPKRYADKPSIAVLPFTNMSGDPDQQYFSDGITEDIITELSRFHELSVLARSALFRFRGQAVDVGAVARELGAQYVVEGSVRKLGTRIRIAVQLIDVESGNHLWAERYDREQQEMFAVQDDIVRSLVGTLVGRLEAIGAERSGSKPPASMVAYDYLLRALAQPIGDLTAEAEARRYLEKAIELDPNYGHAQGLLAYLLSQEWVRDMTGSMRRWIVLLNWPRMASALMRPIINAT